MHVVIRHVLAGEQSTGAHAAAPPAQNVLEVLRARGLVQNVTSEDLGKVSAQEALKVYVGFDPTADAIHLGNLLGLIVLSWFQRCGHTAVVLLGGATGRIGDPSGKSAERPVLAVEEIEHNVASIGNLIRSILKRNQGEHAEVQVRHRMRPCGGARRQTCCWHMHTIQHDSRTCVRRRAVADVLLRV